MLLVCWGKWRRKVEEGAENMRKERVACLHCYNTMLMSVMRVMMLHVVHRRMKRNHYAQLHARVCAAALLPIAIERMAKHCQVARAIICTRTLALTRAHHRCGSPSAENLLLLRTARADSCSIE